MVSFSKDREINEATYLQLLNTGAGIGSGKENFAKAKAGWGAVFEQMPPAGFQILIWPGNTLFQALLYVCTDEQRGQEPAKSELPGCLCCTVISLFLALFLGGVPASSWDWPSPSRNCHRAVGDKLCAAWSWEPVGVNYPRWHHFPIWSVRAAEPHSKTPRKHTDHSQGGCSTVLVTKRIRSP